ncbi:uncharacterized protein LOC143082531 isoform X1 [Mytilus galloprovincialis]|uniref:uncharacterized protein LOC143082531 isoform X1 n=1 Tax=Mytilus galloprovincialis TaxID=29158 RepID=UPI003F7B9732
MRSDRPAKTNQIWLAAAFLRTQGNKMEHLTLQPRPKTTEKEKCLPAGDRLPLWSEVPLFAKLPVYPNIKGSYKLCTTSLCEPKHKTAQIDFDLTDPYGYVAFSQYEPLHDPHLRNHFNIPQTRRHLVRNGYLHDGKVVCDLKEFNKYRQYLRKMFLLELAYEKQKKQCMADSRRSASNDLQGSYTKKRLEMVQKRMEELNKIRRQKYKREHQSKSARQKKRLDELDGERSIRDARNKQRERKRKHTLQQHKEMIERRNQLLMRRWKTQERERQQRLQDAKHKQLMEQRQKIQDSWESRKRSQEEKLSRETDALVRIQEQKDKSIAERERRATIQRQKLQDSLEKIRRKMKQEQEAVERKHARRLAERLALADIKSMARRNAKRRSRKPQFLSMWGIVSSLRRMELSNLKEKRSERFLQMLTDAYDEISIFIDETTYGDEFEDTSANEEEQFQLKAREIVMDVYNTVKQEHYSEMLPLPDDEDYDGHEEGEISFRGRLSVIPQTSGESLTTSFYKPTGDHEVTPVPSIYKMEHIKLEEAKEAERRRQEDMKMAESLLLRLLDDLSQDKLKKDDIVQLTTYCMEMVEKRDYEIAILQDLDVIDLNEYQVSGLADNLVKFTLERLLDDLKRGHLSKEDLTKLTLSIIGSDSVDMEEFMDKAIDKFVEDTLQDIVQDEDLHVESPTNDVMLDDFIIRTLQTLADDVENGRLSKEMIEDMLNLMNAEVSSNVTHESTDTNFKSILQRIIEDLESQKGESLYRVVHAFVSSYMSFKESSQESLSDLVNIVINRITTELSGDSKELETLGQLAKTMSTQSLTTAQMSSIANNVIATLDEEGRSLTEIARLVVEDAIERAKAKIIGAHSNELTLIATTLASSINDVLRESNTNIEVKDIPFAHNVSVFVTDVLKVVYTNLQKGYFTESDVADMVNNVQRIIDSREDKHAVLTNHIKYLLADLDAGLLDSKDLEEIGQELIYCGKKMTDRSSSMERRTPSLTSTAVANNLIEHLLESLQVEFEKGNVEKEALKELALCILQSTSSTISLVASNDSKIAEDVVRSALGQIMEEIDDGKLNRMTLVSMASSAVSIFSEDFDRKETLNTIMRNIISKLREDKISLQEVRAIFRVILRKYQYDHSVLFPREVPTSADSELAESLIRETIIKIDRDLRSGHFSEDELLLFADESKRSRGKIIGEMPDDIINLVSSIIKHLQSQVTESTDASEVIRFLRTVDTENCDNIKTNAEVNQYLNRILEEIASSRHSSSYLKRILRHFVSHVGTHDDILAVGGILQTMNVGVLSNFVKITVADVLSDVRKSRMKSAGLTLDMSHSDTGMLMKTASSMVANRLVQQLLTRVERTVLSGKLLASDTELESEGSEEKDGQRGPSFASFENDLLCRISSNEIGTHILETLNNIISNMRLDRSVDRISNIAGEGYENAQKRISSGVIEDFVLETLQDIVENMQDQMSYADMRDMQGITNDASQTSIFVMDVMNNILKDMAEAIREKEEDNKKLAVTKSDSIKGTSTVSLEAEAVVVEALHNIVRDFVGESDAEQITMNSFNFDGKGTKQYVIGTLQNIKRDFGDPNNKNVRHAVTDIIQNTVEDAGQSKESDHNIDNFVENTIDMIIETLENNKLRTNDPVRRGASQPSVESEVALDLLVIPSGVSESMLLDGRTMSLQKMAEMTTRMLRMYDENVQSTRGSKQEIVGEIPGEKVVELLSEAVSKTLSNVESGKLSEKEVHELATALSERYPVATLNEQDNSLTISKSSASDDKTVEDFVVATLEKVKAELQTGVIDEDRMKMVVQSMTDMHNGSKETIDIIQHSSVTSVPSEIITKLVKNVLSNIASSFSDNDIVIYEDSRKKQGSIKSLSSEGSSKSNKSNDRKANINPNAAKCRLSALSSDRVNTPLTTTPVPILHSYCEIRDKPLDNKEHGMNQSVPSNNYSSFEKTGKSKPMCMVTPQKSAKTTPVANINNRRSRMNANPTNGSPINRHVVSIARTSTAVHKDSPFPGRPILPHHVRIPYADPKRPVLNERVTKQLQTSSREHFAERQETPNRRSTNAGTAIRSPKRATNLLSPKVHRRQQVEQRSVSEQSHQTTRIPPTQKERNRCVSTMEKNEKKVVPTNAKRSLNIDKKSAAKKSSPKIRIPSASSVGDKISTTSKIPSNDMQKPVIKPVHTETLEVKSLCGSHKTKISVRSSNDDENQSCKRPLFH